MQVECTACGCVSQAAIRPNGPHLSAYCPECGKWIKHIPRNDRDDFILYFGKFKDRNVRSMTETPDERSYLRWLLNDCNTIKEWQRDILKDILQ